MQLKHKTQEKENIKNELEKILDNEDYDNKYLKIYFDCYNESKESYSKLCSKCVEWRKLDLPNDCLCNPDYCVKFEEDFWIIKLYEDLKMYIEFEL